MSYNSTHLLTLRGMILKYLILCAIFRDDVSHGSAVTDINYTLYTQLICKTGHVLLRIIEHCFFAEKPETLSFCLLIGRWKSCKKLWWPLLSLFYCLEIQNSKTENMRTEL